MIDRIEHFFRRLRRATSRSEWAIPLLRLPVSEGTATEPGLILIQIDALSRRQMERAMERGRLPFLRRLIEREHYEARTFYSGLPSSTPAVQGELYYGECCAVPAFGVVDRETRRVMTMFQSDWAKKIEAHLVEKGEGLLSGGSSWGNIYCGGAAQEECHFCTAILCANDLFRSRPVLGALTFPILHFPSLMKLFGLWAVEMVIAVRDMFYGLFRGESLYEELVMVFKRVFVCIGLREVVAIGAKIDAARGLPIIHVNFAGYDEQAHRRGPSSLFAHWTLRGIDRVIKNIYRAAHRSARREYQVWIFSDHGQEAARYFEHERGVSLEETIRSVLDGFEPSPPKKRRVPEMPARVQWTKEPHADEVTQIDEPSFRVIALGPIGHLYLKDPADAAQKRELAKRLVRKGIPGVLLCAEGGKIEWIHAGGSMVFPNGEAKFLPHPPPLKKEIARDLLTLCKQEYSGDLILLGWSPDAPMITFANERGAHGGPGPDEAQGFILTPALTRLPRHVKDFLRPSDLRDAALNVLRRKLIEPSDFGIVKPVTHRLRVMTYNVHSCRGMDGRTSPQRIAKVIERYNPDFVALQELDLGRVRSQKHDQPRIIAEQLGMHLSFCATVIDHDEQYGHALLSRFPLKVIRTEILQSGVHKPHVEPRGALWTRVEMDGMRFNLMNTHFGLSRRERHAQAADLLGTNWIGGIPEDEPVILCGDFNMFPRSQPYRALARRLRDVQIGREDFLALNTFASLHPFARIDHIFVSRHFVPQNILVPRNHLTRVASDHLPLIADLAYVADGNGSIAFSNSGEHEEHEHEVSHR
jgi:endonuclease/exonuclease/phosphatase family metal-dependent hydrolase